MPVVVVHSGRPPGSTTSASWTITAAFVLSQTSAMRERAVARPAVGSRVWMVIDWVPCRTFDRSMSTPGKLTAGGSNIRKLGATTPKVGSTWSLSSSTYRSSSGSVGCPPAPTAMWYSSTSVLVHAKSVFPRSAPTAISGSMGICTSLVADLDLVRHRQGLARQPDAVLEVLFLKNVIVQHFDLARHQPARTRTARTLPARVRRVQPALQQQVKQLRLGRPVEPVFGAVQCDLHRRRAGRRARRGRGLLERVGAERLEPLDVHPPAR